MGKTSIPKNERELASAVIGDVIKIAIQDDALGRKIIWMRYDGLRSNKDFFLAQDEPPREQSEPRIAVLFSSSRDSHRYDNTLGVLLDPTYETTFIGPRRQPQEYEKRVAELKGVSLWY